MSDEKTPFTPLQPLGSTVVLRKVTVAEKTKGGIIIHPSAEVVKATGMVVGIGPTVPETIGLKVGQVVLFGSNINGEYPYRTDVYLTMYVSNIHASIDTNEFAVDEGEKEQE